MKDHPTPGSLAAWTWHTNAIASNAFFVKMLESYLFEYCLSHKYYQRLRWEGKSIVSRYLNCHTSSRRRRLPPTLPRKGPEVVFQISQNTKKSLLDRPGIRLENGQPISVLGRTSPTLLTGATKTKPRHAWLKLPTAEGAHSSCQSRRYGLSAHRNLCSILYSIYKDASK